ncbi:MAG: hypothetical protein HRT36_02175 [Alphaproteobacteria bacterium]|nr:hypothetical protein [Alphaproteobacteria bacterium]
MNLKNYVLIFTTSLIVMGCRGTISSGPIMQVSRDTYRSMTCENLAAEYDQVRTRALELHSSVQTPKPAPKEPDPNVPVWEDMLNTSVATVQELFDGTTNGNASAQEIAQIAGKTEAIEDVAVEMDCTPLLQRLTIDRARLRQIKSTQ